MRISPINVPQMKRDWPKKGASSRAAANSTPRLVSPPTNTSTSSSSRRHVRGSSEVGGTRSIRARAISSASIRDRPVMAPSSSRDSPRLPQSQNRARHTGAPAPSVFQSRSYFLGGSKTHVSTDENQGRGVDRSRRRGAGRGWRVRGQQWQPHPDGFADQGPGRYAHQWSDPLAAARDDPQAERHTDRLRRVCVVVREPQELRARWLNSADRK